MDLIENDELILEGFKEEDRIFEPRPVVPIFKIEVKRRPLLSKLEGKRRLPDLSWPDQGDRRLSAEGGFDILEDASLNHILVIIPQRGIITGIAT